MNRGGMRAVLIGLAVAGACLSWLGNSLITYADTDMTTVYGGFAAVIIGIAALWLIFLQLRRQFSRRRVGAGGGTGEGASAGGRSGYVSEPLPFLLPAAPGQGRELTVADGQRLLVEVFAHLREAAILLDAGGMVLAITPSAARQLDGTGSSQRLRDGFDPDDWDYALSRARETGQPLQASLRRLDGPDLLVRISDLGLGGGMVVTLPPRSAALGQIRGAGLSVHGGTHLLGDELRNLDQPLTALPMVSLWVESVRDGDTVMPLVVGTVRLAGARVFKTMTTDLFIDPGRPLPDDAPGGAASYLGAPDFLVSWPVIAEALRGCVVVGIDVDRALGDLRAAADRYGQQMPALGPVLDLARLAAVVQPGNGGPDTGQSARQLAERLAERLGVPLTSPPQGRMIFAPALWQAELAAALLPRLAEKGIVTQADARAVAGVSPAPRFSPAASASVDGDQP